MMLPVPVRRLLIGLETPFAPDWNGGDAFRTVFFNALSMGLPACEQFFIDAVRADAMALPAEAQALYRALGGDERRRRMKRRHGPLAVVAPCHT